MAPLDSLTTEIPPLQGGDRLTRSEFERRYEAMPHLKKAELIDGIVYMLTSVRAESHGRPTSMISAWLTTYAAATPGVRAYDNTTVRLDLDNEIQPDALLRIETACGGQSRINEDDYIEGAPELIVEVAASSAAYDLHDKKTVCRRHGVREYVVWQVFDQKLDWFVLEDDAYLPLEPVDTGILHSRAFPGLYLAVEALLEGRPAEVLRVQQQSTGTPAHTAFIERLNDQRSS